jgi:hypothetical protein
VVSAFRHGDAIGRTAVTEQTHERDAANALHAPGRTSGAPPTAQDDDREAAVIEIEASATSLYVSRHVGFRREAATPMTLIGIDGRQPVVRFHWRPPRR